MALGLDVGAAVDNVAKKNPEYRHLLGKYEGVRTKLKTACEHWVVLRKSPSVKSLTMNVAKRGTGGLNIDRCRSNYINEKDRHLACSPRRGYKIRKETDIFKSLPKNGSGGHPLARYPSNVILDGSEEVIAFFPTTNGMSVSRFFYHTKASPTDRDEGLGSFASRASCVIKDNTDGSPDGRVTIKRNTHPTVKNTELMRYLCRLITPVGGVVLDPFMGSGSTGKACVFEEFGFIGIEKEEEYFRISEARIRHALQTSSCLFREGD